MIDSKEWSYFEKNYMVRSRKIWTCLRIRKYNFVAYGTRKQEDTISNLFAKYDTENKMFT